MSKQLYKILALLVLALSYACGGAYSGGQDAYSSSIEAACSYVDINTLPAQAQLDVPYVRQASNYCGPASLSMVMGYYGNGTNQYAIGQDIVDREGTTAGELIDKAEQVGFAGSVVNCQLGGLFSLLAKGKPVMVRILNDMGNGGHFIVVTGYDRSLGLVYVNDPDQPYRQSETFEAFSRMWNVTTLGDGANSNNLAIVISPQIQLASL